MYLQNDTFLKYKVLRAYLRNLSCEFLQTFLGIENRLGRRGLKGVSQ